MSGRPKRRSHTLRKAELGAAVDYADELALEANRLYALFREMDRAFPSAPCALEDPRRLPYHTDAIPHPSALPLLEEAHELAARRQEIVDHVVAERRRKAELASGGGA